MANRTLVLGVALGMACVLAIGCIGTTDDVRVDAQAWPNGSEIFDDERWLSGDGAITVDLGDERVLWVFGDSRVAPDGERTRENAFFVSNTVAIQRGANPANASMNYHWRTEDPQPSDPLPPPAGDEDPQPQPRPFVADEADGEIAHWPNHGTLVEGKLLLFYNRIERGEGAFGFEARGWTAFLVDNPYQRPLDWELEAADTANPFGDNVSVGAGSVFVHEEHVLAYAVHSVDDGSFTRHEPHLFRWSIDDVLAGDLTSPEVYDPGTEAWIPQAELDALPEPLFEPGAPGWTVHHDEALDRWVQVQISGFPTGPIEVRTAPAPTGPWSKPEPVFEPPEAGIANASTYLAYAHPSLDGADLVVGYSTNPLSDEARRQNPELGTPRLVQTRLATG